jgi:uncharacterized membrane protein
MVFAVVVLIVRFLVTPILIGMVVAVVLSLTMLTLLADAMSATIGWITGQRREKKKNKPLRWL